MICCHQIRTHFIDACEYIVYDDTDDKAWLVDCGEYPLVQQWLTDHHKTLEGIFLTHAHCDHSGGVNDALQEWPHVKVYISANEGLTYLQDERLNQSRYVAKPFTIAPEHCLTLNDGQQVALADGITLTAWQTPGHSPDSLTYRIGHWLFTGDAHIPGTPVVTRIKGSDKQLAQQSEERILHTLLDAQSTICPGHFVIDN